MSCFMVINGSCSTNMCARQLSFNFSSMVWGGHGPVAPPLDPPLHVEFKLSVIARKVIYSCTRLLCHRCQPSTVIMGAASSTAMLLHQLDAPSNFCRNSFFTAVPAVWNWLPPSTHNTVTLSAFRSNFKTCF